MCGNEIGRSRVSALPRTREGRGRRQRSFGPPALALALRRSRSPSARSRPRGSGRRLDLRRDGCFFGGESCPAPFGGRGSGPGRACGLVDLPLRSGGAPLRRSSLPRCRPLLCGGLRPCGCSSLSGGLALRRAHFLAARLRLRLLRLRALALGVGGPRLPGSRLLPPSDAVARHGDSARRDLSEALAGLLGCWTRWLRRLLVDLARAGDADAAGDAGRGDDGGDLEPEPTGEHPTRRARCGRTGADARTDGDSTCARADGHDGRRRGSFEALEEGQRERDRDEHEAAQRASDGAAGGARTARSPGTRRDGRAGAAAPFGRAGRRRPARRRAAPRCR